MRVKKGICTVLAMMLLLSICGCGSEESASGNNLYRKGLEMVEMVAEAARSEVLYEENISVYSEMTQEIGMGDFTAPKAVYSITITEEALLRGIGVESLDSVSEELKNALIRRVLGSFGVQINGLGGVEIISVASALTFGKSFVDKGATENVIYIYTYENAVPIMVLFTVGEEGAIVASGCPLLYEEFDVTSAEKIKAFYEDFELTVQEVLP